MDLFVPVYDVAFDELRVSIRSEMPVYQERGGGVAYGASSLATCSPRSTFRSAIVTKALSQFVNFACCEGMVGWSHPAAANSRTVVSPMPLAPIHLIRDMLDLV